MHSSLRGAGTVTCPPYSAAESTGFSTGSDSLTLCIVFEDVPAIPCPTSCSGCNFLPVYRSLPPAYTQTIIWGSHFPPSRQATLSEQARDCRPSSPALSAPYLVRASSPSFLLLPKSLQAVSSRALVQAQEAPGTEPPESYHPIRDLVYVVFYCRAT